MMKRMNFLVTLGLLSLLSVPAFAGDVRLGEEKSKALCAACHNVDGNSTLTTFPRLAGQNEDYLLHSLKAYKNGLRKNDIMKGIVATLSDDDMANLAAFFAAQKGLIVKK